jgi:hypothetical protein
VKFTVTEYALPLPLASVPLAICCGAPDKVKPPPQAPELPPVTPPQDTFTAERGIVAQLVNDAAAADTFKVHVLPVDPNEVVQLTVAAGLPATLGVVVGSVKLKLIVAGTAEIALSVVAIGKIGLAAGTTTRALG